MAARVWFTAENTQSLTDADRAVLNRAARKAFPVGYEPRRIELVALLTAYKPGMSAAELLEVA